MRLIDLNGKSKDITIDIANIFALTFVSQPVQQCATGRTPLNRAEEASTQSLQTTTGEILQRTALNGPKEPTEQKINKK